MIWRIRDRRTFAELRRRGRRIRRGPFTVTYLPDQGGPPRVAYAIGRPVGGAAVRNRLRRRIQGVTREVAEDLAPGAYLIGAGGPAVDLPYEELRSMVVSALVAAGDRSPEVRS